MPIELKIPHVGESITEVQIAEWLKSEGDIVKKDENVAVIDSEKTTLELPAPEGGRLAKIFHKAGETVKVGDVIGQLEPSGDSEKTGPAEAKTADTAKSKPAQVTKTESAEKAAEPDGAPGTAKESAPAIEKKAPAGGEAEPEKTPPEPRPQPAVKPESSSGREEEVVPMSMLRRTAARRLVEAKQQMAMLTTFNEVDMSAVQVLRAEHQEAFEKKHGVKLGLMSFFVKAAIDALKQFPQLNAEVRESDIVYRNYFDIGVAIASERGLVVPVLRNAERMSFAEVEKTIGDLARRARDGSLKPAELEGGTFTITNGGVFGSLLSTPIINPPQSGILGLHAIQERPVAVQGQAVIRPMMYVALTYDHRIVDGREAVLFLRRIKEIIEKPARLLIDI